MNWTALQNIALMICVTVVWSGYIWRGRRGK